MQISNKKFVLIVIVLSGMFQPIAYSAQQEEVDLGRLFTSSKQRVELNRQRREELVQDDIVRTSADQQAKPETETTVVVNGVLKRSNGDKVVWINGKKVQGTTGPGNVRVYRGPDSQNRVVIGVPGKRVAKLGPGQQLILPHGRVAETYISDVDGKAGQASGGE